MGNAKVVNALNGALSSELTAIVQYLYQHWTAKGLESETIRGAFESVSRDEMKHAEMLAERIVALGGDPTTAIATVKKDKDLVAMMTSDVADENAAIKMYKGFIKLCQESDDSTSRLLLENILSDEEGHLDKWETILGK